MSSLSKLELLRGVNTKLVNLPVATAAARESGAIGEADEFVARIRKVTAKEMAQTIGRVPRFLAVYRERRPDETDAEFSERMRDRALDDDELRELMLEEIIENTRAVAIAGVTGIGIRAAGGDVEVDPVELTFEGDLRPERVLGHDLDAVADAISYFSRGVFDKVQDAVDNPDGRRGGGADQTGAFPGERPGDPAEPDSEGHREDPDGVPGPTPT